jgi:acyl carrier protein
MVTGDSTITDIEDRIRTFLVAELLGPADPEQLAPDAPLLSGFLDSFGLVTLLAFLEETYEIGVDNSEVVDENFGTVQAVARFVVAKQAEQAEQTEQA